MNLESLLLYFASVAEAVVIALLFYRRVWRNFPLFVVYSIWTLAVGIGVYVISRSASPTVFLTTYLAEVILDSILLFSVLVELAWSLLRPIRASLSRGVLVAIGAVLLTLGAMVWPFTHVPGTGNVSREWHILLHLQQTESILQILTFLGVIASTQLLSIGWRDRELQIATGLGFSSLVGLTVTLLQQQPAFRLEYNHLNLVPLGAYICCLFYWIFAFAQKEEERREFTPQMQSMLLAVAGAARATRIALADSDLSTREGDRR